MLMKAIWRLTVCVGLLGLAEAARADTNVVTDPVGFYKVDLLGNSDTVVTIPFTRSPAYVGLVDSVSESNVVIAGSPGWTANQWAYPADGSPSNTYYALFRTSDKEGAHFTILSNTTDTLILDLDVEDLSSISNGTQVSIIPYWTLGTAFPSGDGVAPSASQFSHATEILIPNFDGTGINLAPSQTYYYYGGYWRKVGGGTANYNAAVLVRDGYFLARQNTSTNPTFVPAGTVQLSKLRIPLYTQAGGQQDNFVALTRPANVSLTDSGLYESGAFSNSPSQFSHTDELLVFDNAYVAMNKAPVETYYRLLAGWRKVGGGSVDYGATNVFVPGKGYLIRKGAVTGGPFLFWINSAKLH